MNDLLRVGRMFAVAAMLALATRTPADGFRLTASGGIGQAYGQTYLVLGGRVGYDVAFGLTPEVGLSFWTGASPSFAELSPGLTWYMPVPIVRPYLGGFYAHDFVSSGLPDQDALGVRGGIGLLGAGPLSVNLGVAYSHRLSCTLNCDLWWPEASAGFGF